MSDTVPVVGRIYSFRTSIEAVLGSFASAVSPTPSISSLAASCPPSPALRSPNSPHAFKTTPGPDLIHARENAILEAVKSARLRKRGCSQQEDVHHGDPTDDGETPDDETPAKRYQIKKFFASSTATSKEVGSAHGTKDSESVDADWNSDDDGWSSDGSAEDDTCLPYIDLYEDLDIEP